MLDTAEMKTITKLPERLVMTSTGLLQFTSEVSLTCCLNIQQRSTAVSNISLIENDIYQSLLFITLFISITNNVTQLIFITVMIFVVEQGSKFSWVHRGFSKEYLRIAECKIFFHVGSSSCHTTNDVTSLNEQSPV